MKSTWKRWVSVFLAVLMMVQLFPTTAFAVNDDDIVVIGDWEDEDADDIIDEEIPLVETEDEDEIRLIDGKGEDLGGEGKKTYYAEDVLWENRELRDAGTKHFHLSDGTDVAVLYKQQVHYLDDSGEYQDIDNTLELVDRDGVHEVKRLPGEESVMTPGEEADEMSPADEEDLIIIELEEADSESEEPILEVEPSTEDVVEAILSEETAAEEADEEASLEVGSEEGSELLTIDDPSFEEAEEKTDEEEEDSEGEKDIELTEEEDTDGEKPKEKAGKEYRNRAGLIDVRLAELSNAGDLISLSDGKNTLRFTPAWEIEERPAVLMEPEFPYDSDSFEAAVTPRTLTAGLRYEEVLPGVDLEYWVHPSGVKENIVLREPIGEASFSFILDCGELTAYLENDGSITLCDREGACVMCIPAGYMLDAQGEYSEGIIYDLADWGEGKYLLTIHADNEWLNEEGRAYPVNIDPAVAVTAYNYYSGLSSNYVNSSQTSPAGTHQILRCGYDLNAGDYQYYEYRIMLGFDQLPNLPANCMVVRSVLSLEQPTTGYSGSEKNYYVHQVNMAKPSGCSTYASWINNNLIWAHTTGSNISTEVLDYFTASHATANVVFDCDVTRAVKHWYSDPSVPHAFCVRRSEITSGNAWVAIQGYSSQYLCGPSLSVYYRNTVGLEDYFSYQSHSIDRAGTGYIGDYTGQLTLVETDVSSASTVCPVAISHIFNSAYYAAQIATAAPGASGYSSMTVGRGWKLNVQQSVTVDDTNYLRYMDADGTIHYFYKTATNTYKDEDGLNLTITASGTNYTMTDRYGNSQYFSGGLLSYSQDSNGNKITYVRDSSDRVTSVTRKLNGSSTETIATLTYSGNYLSTITDSANQTTSFTYSGGKLTKITHADGTTVSYSYYDSGRLKTAKDNESTYSMTYSYDDQGLISEFTEKAGSTTGASVEVTGAAGVRTYRYCGKDRTLNSTDDLLSSYVFDYFGRTISSSTRNANSKLIYGASAAQYSTNSGTAGTNNRLTVGSGVGMRPVGETGGYTFISGNLLSYGDMSSSSGWSGGTIVTDNTFGKAAKVTGAAGTQKKVSQTVTVNTAGTQTYILSGWARASSVALSTDDRSFELRATIKYSDNTSEVQKSSYCADSTEWQYNVLPIVPKQPNKTVSTITVAFAFDSNPNTAYFTYACLTKEVAQSYKYNSSGDLVSVDSPSNATHSYSYSGADLISQTLQSGSDFQYTYEYTYDSHHNVTGVEYSGLSMALAYDAKGNATSSTLTGGSLTMGSSATYTNNGNLVGTQTDTRGKTTTYTYGNAISKQLGQPTAVKNAKNITTNTTYEPTNGRVTGSSMTGVSLAYTYGNGRLTAMTRTVGSATQTYNMGYNGFGQLTSVKVGTRSLASYTYNSNNGPLNKLTYGNGNTFGYAYDNLERVTNVYYNNSSSPSLTYSYYGEGTLKSLTDSVNNRSYTYTYDSLNRLTAMTEKQGSNAIQSYEIIYDTANRQTNLNYRLSLDFNGTLSTARAYANYFNSDGSLKRMATPTGSLKYTYDSLNRLTVRMMSTAGVNYLKREYQYLAGSGSNTSTLVSSLACKTANNTMLYNESYSYDAVGNITAVSGGKTASYTYDSQNQLTKEVLNGTTYNYTYDAGGNIKTKTKISGSGTDTFTYSNSEWRDLLTAYNGNSITYDTVGNPTSYYDGASMTWVNGKRLASISATNNHAAMSFTYNSDGLRLTKTVGTGSSAVVHKYIWQGDRLVYEKVGSRTIEFSYDENDQPYAMRFNGDLYYFVRNLQGDVVAIVKRDGTVYATYEYNAWGEVLSVNDMTSDNLGTLNPIRYRGYYYDSESGFYYLKSRYYDPKICRFINADGFASTGQGFVGYNMFAYCGNNPVFRKDIDGNDWDLVGAGVQLDASASLGEISGGAGVEVVIYWGTEEAKELGEPVVAVYVYGGGSLNIALLAEDITNVTNLLTESVELLKIDGASALEAATLTGQHSLSGAVTLSGFLVFGNEGFKDSKNYTEGFDTFSAGYGKGRINYAWSDCCQTVGVGVSVLGGSAGWSVMRGKSYYGLLWSSACTK